MLTLRKTTVFNRGGPKEKKVCFYESLNKLKKMLKGRKSERRFLMFSTDVDTLDRF